MDIEKDRDSLDSLMEDEVKETPSIQFRKDQVHPKTFNNYLKVDSDVLFEDKPSDQEQLEREAENIFNSRKIREPLYNQAIHKARWRLTPENKVVSNSKLVRWSDGSYGIYIGEDYYELSGGSTGNQMVYLAHNNNMLSAGQLNYSGTIKQEAKIQGD